MMEHANNMKGSRLKATDGSLGAVQDFYFDDRFWSVRYLVADTGTWLPGRQVLLSPYALSSVDTEAKEIITTLNRKQIEDSPSLETDNPVSQQYEESYFGYFGWPSYWGGVQSWGGYPYPSRDPGSWASANDGAKPWDVHLRSMREVNGYHLQAIDGEIGHVTDFLVDTETWSIRYLVVATKNWWPGKKVLLSPTWIDRVSSEESKLYVDETREQIKTAPEFTDATLLTREFETQLHQHYRRSAYWELETAVGHRG